MPDILLVTLNARYSHASMGLRCLRANLQELKPRSALLECVISDPVDRIVERILASNAKIVGFGVYIWNLRQTEAVAALVRDLCPQTVIVIGGPEVSFGTDHTTLDGIADHIISGEADLAFAQLCRDRLAGTVPAKQLIGGKPDLATVALPYEEYTDEDLSRRIIYVEASRGCPFTCEFCLSSLDDGVRTIALERFLPAMDDLIQRRCRTFKFVDRTFNLKPSSCTRILDFFFERWPRNPEGTMVVPLSERQMDQGAERNQAFFLHFEMVPDRLPEVIKQRITQFPAGAIQFEIGIQSFTPAVGELISRRMDQQRTMDNLQWLREHGGIHVHADLIVGLPGECPETFNDSYDQLAAMNPGEIQIGILKLLRGTPLIRHRSSHGMVFSRQPPYELMASTDFPFSTMQRYKRFAKYHELFVNSGRFPRTIDLFCASSPSTSRCQSLLALSDWLWQRTGQDHALALTRQYDLMVDALAMVGVGLEQAAVAVVADFMDNGQRKGLPARLHRFQTEFLQLQAQGASL